MHKKIAVIGTGAIGTSIGLALKASGIDAELVGHDKSFEQARLAKRRGAFDRVEWNLIRAVESADLIVLALPTAAIRPTLQAIRQDVQRDVIITDTAEVKGVVLRWAAQTLPTWAHFVGGNPLVRVPGTGPEAAYAELFQRSRYCVVPSVTAKSEAVETAVHFVELLGARPIFVDADEHDALIAPVRHLPTLLAMAMISLVAESPSWREFRAMTGPLYMASETLPEVEPAEVREFLYANRESLVGWIDRLLVELKEWRDLLEEADEQTCDDRIARLFEAFVRWNEADEWERTRQEIRQYGDFFSLLLGSRPVRPRRR